MNYRKNTYEEPKVPMDTRWVWRAFGFVGGFLLIGFGFGTGVECYRWDRLHPSPSVPDVCRDSVEIVNEHQLERKCDVGAHVETSALPSDSSKLIVRCVCAASANAVLPYDAGSKGDE